MGINVIGAILCVVLHDKNRGRGPEFRSAHGLDHATQGQIIFSHVRGRSRLARRSSGRVIVRESHNLQARHFSLALKSMQFGDESVRPGQVAVIHVETPEVRIKMSLERRNQGRTRIIGGRTIVDEFAVASVGHLGRFGSVPKITAGGLRNLESPLARIGVFTVLIVAVTHRPYPLDEVRRVSTHGPFVAIGTHFALDVEVVEQHELAGESMMVRGDGFGKQAQGGIALPLRHVAQHLIVGAVFFDDVNAMANGRGVAGDQRHGVSRPQRCRRCRRAARQGSRGVPLQLPLQVFAILGQLDDGQGPRQETANVFTNGCRRFAAGLRAHAIRLGSQPLAIGHQKPPTIRSDADRSGIPSGWDESHRSAATGLPNIKNGDRVDVGVRHEEQGFVGAEGHTVGR